MRTFIALAVLIVLLTGYEVLAQQTCSGFYQSCLSVCPRVLESNELSVILRAAA